MKKKTFEKKIAKEIKRVDELLKNIGKVSLRSGTEVSGQLVAAAGALVKAQNVVHSERKSKPSKKMKDININPSVGVIPQMKIRRTKKR